MRSPPKPRKSAARPSPRQSRLRPNSIQHKPAKEAPPPAQEAPKKWHSPAARDPVAEGQRRDKHKNSRRHQPPGRPFASLMKHNPEPEKRVVRQTSLRGCKDFQRAFLQQKEGHKSPKRGRLQVWSLRGEFVHP